MNKKLLRDKKGTVESILIVSTMLLLLLTVVGMAFFDQGKSKNPKITVIDKSTPTESMSGYEHLEDEVKNRYE